MAMQEERIKKLILKDFDKGLVSNVTNEALEDKEFPLLKNWDTNNRGGYVRRLGYGDIMPSPAIEGTQQGYIQFIAKPYGILDLDQLFDFGNHITPKETETAQETKLLAVSGKLYLAENDITGIGEIKTESIFKPELINWEKTIALDTSDDTISLENDSTGALVINFTSSTAANTIDTSVAYDKDIAHTLTSILFTIDYSKDNRFDSGLGSLIETYTIYGDVSNNITLVITQADNGGEWEIFYELFENGVSLQGGVPTSIFLFPGAYAVYNPTYEFGISGTDIIFKEYIDDVLQEDISYTKSIGDLVNPNVEAEFVLQSIGETNSADYNVAINNFKVEYDITEESQDVGDIIYPITSLNEISSNHSVITNFQTTELIDFVTKDNQMFITTGTKLLALRYVTLPSGTVVLVAQEVDQFAFEPNTQEVAIGGLNLIKTDPFESISDITNGVTYNPDFARLKTKYGITNVDNVLKCFVTLKVGEDIEYYDFSVDAQKHDTATPASFDIAIQGFVRGEDGRRIIVNIAEPTTYNFKITMRPQGDSDTAKYKYVYIFGYEVNSIDKNKDINLDDVSEQINNCLNIIQYYNKIILYNNDTQNIYKSFSGKTTWFTISGVVPLNALKQEIVKKIIPSDNALIGFTKNSIVALVGKGDDIQIEGYPYEPFSKFITLDGNIGALSPQSVVRTNDGRLIFLSNQGLYIAYNIDLNSEVIQTKKIDDNIDNLVLRKTDACGIIYDNKYYLCYPTNTRIIKWHYVYNDIFTLDESDELAFRKMYIYDNKMYGISILNKIMEHKRIYGDDLGSQIDAEQLIVNGNFVDTTGWEDTNSVNTFVDNIAINTADGGGDSAFLKNTSTHNPAFETNTEYYFTVDIKVTNDDADNLIVYYGPASGGLIIIETIATPTKDKWYQVSGTFTTGSSGSGSMVLYFKQDYDTSATALDKVMKVKEVMIFKTEDTQMTTMTDPTIDLIINEYAEGENTWYADGTDTSTLENIDNLKLSNLGLFTDDDEVFLCEIESKNFSLGYSEFVKKLYEFFIGFNSVRDNKVKLYLNVYSDNVAIISTDEDGVVITQDVDGYDIVSDYDSTMDDLSQQTPNIEGHIPITVGSWVLSTATLGFLAQTYRYFEVMDTKESMRIKFNIKHQQDSYVLLSHFGFVYEIGYIPKSSNYRL